MEGRNLCAEIMAENNVVAKERCNIIFSSSLRDFIVLVLNIEVFQIMFS